MLIVNTSFELCLVVLSLCQLEIAAGNNVCCMRNNPQQRHLVATGGNENTVKLWSLERPMSPMFTAKNVCKKLIFECICIYVLTNCLKSEFYFLNFMQRTSYWKVLILFVLNTEGKLLYSLFYF